MKKNFILALIICVSIGLVGCKPSSEKQVEKSVNDNESTESRVYVDATGKEFEFKDSVDRISILHSAYLEYFMALDHAPTASAGSSTGNAMKALEEWETLKPYNTDEDIMDLGSSRDLNLEAILQSRPDVIVTFKDHGNLDAIEDQLSKIAPLVRLDFTAPWQQQLMDCAGIIGKEDKAKELIETTEKVLTSTQEKLKTYDKTIAVFRTDGKSFIVRADKNYYSDFGIKKPEGFPDTYESLSLETLSSMNPDYIVFQDYYEVSEAFVKTQESSPVWQNLKAVQNDDIYFFDDSLNTLGPLARKLTAEKLLEIYEAN